MNFNSEQVTCKDYLVPPGFLLGPQDELAGTSIAGKTANCIECFSLNRRIMGFKKLDYSFNTYTRLMNSKYRTGF